MKEMVHLSINNKSIECPSGTNILFLALDNGIYIPHLCARRGDNLPGAACRLCWVEADGITVPACTLVAEDGMVVNTRGKKAEELAKSAFEMLMASHDTDCAHCGSNGKCELQKIGTYLGVPLKKLALRTLLRGLPPDQSHARFIYYPERCVLCGQCVYVCRATGKQVLGYAGRSFERRIATFQDRPFGEVCGDCFACVESCPTGALLLKTPAG